MEGIDLTLNLEFSDIPQINLRDALVRFAGYDRILDDPVGVCYGTEYYNIFGMDSPSIKRMDEWYAYMFCSGHVCDCCGQELNFLNRYFFSFCLRCWKKDEDKRNEFNLNSDENLTMFDFD